MACQTSDVRRTVERTTNLHTPLFHMNFTGEWYRNYQMKRAEKLEIPRTNDVEFGVPIKNEADLHEQIITECERRQWPYLHGAMNTRTHRTLGEPDFVILAPNGETYLVECKRKDGKLSPAQLAFKVHAETVGHIVHVIRSFQQFLELVS